MAPALRETDRGHVVVVAGDLLDDAHDPGVVLVPLKVTEDGREQLALGVR